MNPAKRQKLRTSKQSTENNSISESNVIFTSMNDDCIREILSYLPLNDLCSLCQQCQRLYYLTKEQFNRRYQHKAEMLKYLENESLTFDWKSCFATNQKVSIGKSMENSKSVETLIAFYKNKPSESYIEEIHFENWSNLGPSRGRSIGSILRNTKSIHFSYVQLRTEFFRSILQYLPSMEQLTIWGSLKMKCKEKEQNKWLLQTYPTLTYFAWHVYEELNVNDELTIFFKQNATIKQFSLMSNNIQTINRCVDNGIAINELFFRVGSDVETVLRDLKQFFADDQTKRLHLLFEAKCRTGLEQNHNHLIALKNHIDGLYFHNFAVQASLSEIISKFDQLKILQIPSSTYAEFLIDLPNLAEVYVENQPYIFGNGQSFLNLVLAFASRSAKLTKMMFRCSLPPQNVLLRIDEARKNLAGAEKLNIYINQLYSFAPSFDVSFENKFDQIKIFKLEEGQIKNPFVFGASKTPVGSRLQ